VRCIKQKKNLKAPGENDIINSPEGYNYLREIERYGTG